MDQLASRIKELPVEMITEILNNLPPQFYVVYENWTENIAFYKTIEDALAWFIWNLQFTDEIIQVGSCEQIICRSYDILFDWYGNLQPDKVKQFLNRLEEKFQFDIKKVLLKLENIDN